MSKFDKIVKITKIILAKPNTQTNYFWMCERGRMLMIDVAKVPNLPTSLHMLHLRQRAYFFIDMNDTASVRYYAFNVLDEETGQFAEEIEGTTPWNSIEENIWEFLDTHLVELCTFSDARAELDKDYSLRSNVVRDRFGAFRAPAYHDTSNYKAEPAHKPYLMPQSNTGVSSTTASHSVWSTQYKEKEEFCDKIYALLKSNATGRAIDYINNKLSLLIKDEKYEVIEMIFRTITFEKVDLLIMIELLMATKSINDKLKDRASFFDKVKKYVSSFPEPRSSKIIKSISTSILAEPPISNEAHIQ